MSGIKLYYNEISPPSRAVLLVGKALGITFDLQNVDLLKGETKTPDFAKLNPQKAIPVINDNGFVLQESRAIIQYLVEAYGKSDSFYPKDLKQKAVVHSRLYFESGILVPRFINTYVTHFYTGTPIDESKLKLFNEALEMLDKFLEGNEWVAGSAMTIADMSIVASISSAEACGHDLAPFKNVSKWLNTCKSVKGYEVNDTGANKFGAYYKANVK